MQVLWLNTELFLLHGFSFIPRSIGLECLLFPTRWFTRSAWKDRKTLAAMAQLERTQQHGRFLWMIAPDHSDNHALQLLLDQFCAEAGQRGCLHLTASIDDASPLVEQFKLNGFSPLGWEHVLLYENLDSEHLSEKTGWRKTNAYDIPAINALQNKILSLTEKWTANSIYENPPQYTLEINDELLGFAFVMLNGSIAVITPTYSNLVQSPQKMTKSLIQSHLINVIHAYIFLKSNHPQSTFSLLEHYKIASGTKIRMVKHIAVRNVSEEAERNQITNGQKTDVLTPLSKSFKDKIVSSTKK